MLVEPAHGLVQRHGDMDDRLPTEMGVLPEGKGP